MTIDFEGNTNYDINFEFGEGTNVGYGCSATLNGDFWVFGGLDNEQQVSFDKHAMWLYPMCYQLILVNFQL